MGRVKKYLIVFVVCAGFLSIAIGLRSRTAQPAAKHPYLDDARFWVLAHRGGRSLGPENTIHTFRKAINLGVDVIELDVQASLDGHLVVFHDQTVNRTTEGNGRVQDMTLAQLKKLDAAYRWAPDGGRRFPLRGEQISIPTLSEVFAEMPFERVNIEIKARDKFPVAKLCRLIRNTGRIDRVMVASFNAELLKEFRNICPEVATAATGDETRQFVGLTIAGLARMYRPAAQAFQVPEQFGKFQVVNRAFVSAAHERNMKVHVWTVNDIASMQRLIDLQVDGIVTDHPEKLLRLLQSQ